MSDFDEIERTIEASGLFDARWYVEQYPDVVGTGLDPLTHYLQIGARIGRNPGPRFDTRFYLGRYPDAAKAGINPLLHYLQYGARSGRLPYSRPVSEADTSIDVDVIVPVYNAIDDVRNCLNSLRTHDDGCMLRVIVVNDGSNAETTECLRQICQNEPRFELIEHEGNRGYTQAVNTGLKLSRASYVVTLNSDTIVTRGWLRGMIRCMASDEHIGVVGPLSNAASWQNVPELLDESKNFAVNALDGISVDEMAALVQRVSSRRYPRTPFVNGFCYMIRRRVIDAVGYMDAENFPIGYGEENDYCIRVADAGYSLAIADDVYVFHAKSKSFGHARRIELGRQGSENLRRKHGADKVLALIEKVKVTTELDAVRAAIRAALARRAYDGDSTDPLTIRVLFLLPVKGGSGGAHSVVQEVTAMRRLGLHAHVGVDPRTVSSFQGQYADIAGVAETFVGIDADTAVDVAMDYDVVVGTIYASMWMLKDIVEASPHILPAYYIQDYEPLFFPKGTGDYRRAVASYSLLPNAVLFAKTHWLADKVEREHGRFVHKVEPSLDHEVYRPGVKRRDGRVTIAAMIRPRTPRRGAERTMEMCQALAARLGAQVEFRLFGCESHAPEFLALPHDFPFENRGILQRGEVAALLAESDIFVDLSDYQAFGRTAIEAMACGCAVVVPEQGGADEFAIDGVNALVVNVFDPDAVSRRLDGLISNPAALRRMQAAALRTAAGYSIHAAAVSECTLFAAMLARHRALNPVAQRQELLLVPEVDDTGVATAHGYRRLLLPYRSSPIRRAWRTSLALAGGSLPEPGSARTVIFQRDPGPCSLDELAGWLDRWHAAGGRIACDIPRAATFLEPKKNISDARREGLDRMRWLISHADEVSVGPPELLKAAKLINERARHVPSRLDSRLWELEAPRNHDIEPYGRQPGTVLIGYLGGEADEQNLPVIAEAVQQLQALGGDPIRVEVITALRRDMFQFGERVGLPRNREYPAYVRWLLRRVHWDIALVPAAVDADREDAVMRFLSCAALDTAIVCSAVPALERLAGQGTQALLVQNKTEDWLQAIRQLIADAQQRASLAAAARSMVADRFVHDRASAEYIAMLSSV